MIILKEKLLEMKGICKEFSGNQILFDVDFDLNYGEVHALVGENGAGNSTLIKILAGVYQPERGNIFIDGKQTTISSPAESSAPREGRPQERIFPAPWREKESFVR